MRIGRLMAALAGALLLATQLPLTASAQRADDRRFDDRRYDERRYKDREWQLLGQKEVGFRVDRDIIRLGHREDWYRNRSFRALHFVASGAEIHLINVRLVYLNGFSEDLRIDTLVRVGQDVPLDLRGDRSYLREIELTYRARPDFRGRATMLVYGEPARRGSPRPAPFAGRDEPRRDAWIELGCHQVALVGKDRDIIPVGRREGRFKAIRLGVRGSDVEVRDLTVVYANGEPDNLQVRRLIRAGEFTRPLDLKGWERAIDRVEMTFKNIINPLDVLARQRLTTANVCVQGLQ